jgi:hypothetical protein
MSLKQMCILFVFFSDDEDEPTDSNVILDKPDYEAWKYDKAV